MDVAVTDLRARLSHWLAEARSGREVIVTERGVPVARLRGMGTADTIERLTAEGLIARPEVASRPVATGRPRPRPRRPVSDVVGRQRD